MIITVNNAKIGAKCSCYLCVEYMIKDIIFAKAQELEKDLVQVRRHLHQYPELSEQESNTMNFIDSELNKISIPHQCNIGGYGITGHLKGSKEDGPVILLRADIDALPIHETNHTDYCSKIDGVMHACGHDVHATCLIGALAILNPLRDRFPGTIKFVFQPAEEKLPGGATRIIASGFLEQPRPDVALALHVFPNLEVGTCGFRSGMYMASCDELYITIKGRGGHSAIPAELNNPLYIAAELICELEQLALRLSASDTPTVLSFGDLHAHGATNVVPDRCSLSGTFRTMNEPWRSHCHEEIIQIIKNVAAKRSAVIDCNLVKGYPYLINDEQVTFKAIQSARNYLGESNVRNLDIRMASEDFAYYSQIIPSCFFRLGTGNKQKGITAPVHTSTFDIDEKALVVGSGLLAYMAIEFLNS